MIRRLHSRLQGRPRREQVGLLASAGLGDADLEAMDDLASEQRVGSAHAEYPLGSSVYCGICGIVDVGEDCDLFWHPWTAPLPAPQRANG